MPDRITELPRRLLRRGPIHAWWLARQTRRWERAYCNEILRPSPKPAAAATPPSFSTSAPLRTILCIADCMCEEQYLAPELRKLAAVILFDLRPVLQAKPASQPESEAVATAISAFAQAQAQLAPDVILFYARPKLLSEEVFHTLRQRWRCPLFGISMDDKMEFFPYGIFRVGGGDDYQQWARKFDLNLTNCLPATDWYRQRGLPCLYVPNGFHRPDGLRPPESLGYKHEFSFLGSSKPERRAVIDRLLAAGVPIQLFGAGWPSSQWVDDPNAIYRLTQINLGIGLASPSLTLTTLKGRDFECPGVGACYLTTYSWELANLYDVGKEILCYQSVEELIEMFTWYRRRPEECLRIAQAAWRRCGEEHTWEQRYRKVFQQTGFKLA